ncbi:MAG TPA: efflux RND transporter periplasmic adaptor subunit [Polyangiaceae bacterium]
MPSIWLLPLSAVLLLSLSACESKSKAAKAEEAIAVSVVAAALQDVPRELQAFGTVEASVSIDIVSQVQGLVTEVHFKEGDFVKRGDLLFTIDTRPYRASLAATQAELTRNRALAEQAKLEADRAERLRVEGVATDQDVAKAQSEAASTAANVRLSQAQMQSASLNVTFSRIVAPMDGRTGSILVNPGNLVHSNDTHPLVTLRSLSPVDVRFSVPQDYLGVIRAGMDKPLTVRVTPRGQGAASVEGSLTFLDNTVDITTGTVMLKASFPNAGQELWPGASVEVALVLGVDRQATVVPEAALQRSQAGNLVFVIGPDGRAEPRPVQVLRTTSTLALLGSGVQPGERVVTDGQLRLRKGSKVSIKAPSAKLAASVSAEEKRPEGL